jgi:hypothetical protein
MAGGGRKYASSERHNDKIGIVKIVAREIAKKRGKYGQVCGVTQNVFGFEGARLR